MLASGQEMLVDARSRGEAIAAFTTYTLEFTRGICDAAADLGMPVILQAGSSSFREVGMAMLAASSLAMARQSTALIGVHLDHSTDPSEIRACIALGYSSVMIDGSRLPFEDNVELTKSVVVEAHSSGAWVEAELGAIAGDEGASTEAPPAELTSPAQAVEFTERTGVDALAVAIGNVHGMVRTPVHVDLELLSRIASAVPIPLVLHGASGLLDEELIGAVHCGVAKVNFNAELRRAYLRTMRQGGRSGDDVTCVQADVISAIATVAAEKIRTLSGWAHGPGPHEQSA